MDLTTESGRLKRIGMRFTRSMAMSEPTILDGWTAPRRNELERMQTLVTQCSLLNKVPWTTTRVQHLVELAESLEGFVDWLDKQATETV